MAIHRRGGEDDEAPEQAARREAFEEGGIPLTIPMYRLQASDTVAVTEFRDRHYWPRDLYVIPQYTFAVNVDSRELALSHEHTEARWVDYETARNLLRWDINKTALWELRERLRRADLPTPLLW